MGAEKVISKLLSSVQAAGLHFMDKKGYVGVIAWMIEHGWAWHYRAYSKDAKLDDLEQKAMEAKIGLWADSKQPQPPWEYRAAQRAQEQPEKTQKPTDAVVGKWWLNTSSGVRHNSACKYYGQTSKGRSCGKDEGKACAICGG